MKRFQGNKYKAFFRTIKKYPGTLEKNRLTASLVTRHLSLVTRHSVSERQHPPLVHLIQYLGNATVNCREPAEDALDAGNHLDAFVSGEIGYGEKNEKNRKSGKDYLQGSVQFKGTYKHAAGENSP